MESVIFGPFVIILQKHTPKQHSAPPSAWARVPWRFKRIQTLWGVWGGLRGSQAVGGPLAFPLRGGLLDTSLLSFSRKKMKGSDSKPSIYRPGGLLCQHSINFCEAPSSSCSSTAGVARGRWRRSRRRLPIRTRRRVLRPTKTREHLSAPHRRLRHPHRQQD